MLSVELPAFTKVITKLPDEDYAAFQTDLAAQPEQGDLIRGTGGLRKARMGFPSLGVGKSGGARVIYLYIPERQLIVLFTVYAKVKKSDLTKAEENALRELSAEIRRAFGAGGTQGI